MTQQLTTLPILDLNHPGANDVEYRKRRDAIIQKAIEFHSCTSKLSNKKERGIPVVEYSEEEHKVWRHICQKLKPLHEKWACSIYLEGRKKLGLDEKKIPQLKDLHTQLQSINGFKLEPIHGLVDPREFLMKLEHKTMLCTQYIRHHSKPEFTPEPDVVHEIVGHVPLWTNDALVQFSRLIGRAARIATEEEVKWLSNLYWFTVEFGLIEEQGEIKAFGAGLLGGISDLTNAMSGKATIKPFTTDEVIKIDYNYSFEQPVFFVIPRVEFLLNETRKLVSRFEKGNEILGEVVEEEIALTIH
jgi:phenylalanine-4-hydroxylase